MEYSRARNTLKEALTHIGSFDEEEVAVRFAAVWLLFRGFDWPKLADQASSDKESKSEGET